jgi:hypothetical protein
MRALSWPTTLREPYVDDRARAAGYRPRSVGAHYHTFAALETADPAFAPMSVYFDSCRAKRNVSEYEISGGITDTEADGHPVDGDWCR